MDLRERIAELPPGLENEHQLAELLWRRSTCPRRRRGNIDSFRHDTSAVCALRD